MTRASDGWRHGIVNIKHLSGRVTLLFGHFLNLWDEKRCNNEFTRRYVEPCYEKDINAIKKQCQLGYTAEDFALSMLHIYQTIRCNLPEGRNLSLQYSENLKSSMQNLPYWRRKLAWNFTFKIYRTSEGDTVPRSPGHLYAAVNILDISRSWNISCKNETLNFSHQERWWYIWEFPSHISHCLNSVFNRQTSARYDRHTNTFQEEEIYS